MTQVAATLQVEQPNASLAPLKVGADAASPTGVALPTLDAGARSKLDTLATSLAALLVELQRKLEAGQEVELGPVARAALESITATVSNFPADFPDAAVLAKVEAVRALLAATLTVGGTVAVSNLPATQPVSGPLTDAQLRASAPAVRDDYQAGECLAEQTGVGGVLTFTFSSPVHLVHVQGDGSDTDVARVDPFGGTPTASRGFRADDGVGIYLPVTTSSVKVFAPVDMVVTVNGFRRS